MGWPDGSFSPTFCYWSPIITNYQSGYFTPNPAIDPTGTVHTWKTQWQAGRQPHRSLFLNEHPQLAASTR